MLIGVLGLFHVGGATHLGHWLMLGGLEIGAFEVYKCIFGGRKCRFECLYYLHACLIHLSVDLSWLSAFVHCFSV